jgi:hypothetical protein
MGEAHYIVHWSILSLFFLPFPLYMYLGLLPLSFSFALFSPALCLPLLSLSLSPPFAFLRLPSPPFVSLRLPSSPFSLPSPSLRPKFVQSSTSIHLSPSNFFRVRLRLPTKLLGFLSFLLFLFYSSAFFLLIGRFQGENGKRNC